MEVTLDGTSRQDHSARVYVLCTQEDVVGPEVKNALSWLLDTSSCSYVLELGFRRCGKYPSAYETRSASEAGVLQKRISRIAERCLQSSQVQPGCKVDFVYLGESTRDEIKFRETNSMLGPTDSADVEPEISEVDICKEDSVPHSQLEYALRYIRTSLFTGPETDLELPENWFLGGYHEVSIFGDGLGLQVSDGGV